MTSDFEEKLMETSGETREIMKLMKSIEQSARAMHFYNLNLI